MQVKSIRLWAALLLTAFSAFTLTLPFLPFLSPWLAYAQTACQDPPVATPPQSWPQDTTVSFQISDNATDAQKTAVRAAFSDWTGANSQNNSNVSFQEFTAVGPVPLNIVLCSIPGCADEVNGAPASIDRTVDPNTGDLVGATITIDTTKVTTNEQMLQAVLHEIGHTMGLNHPPGFDPFIAGCGELVQGSVMNVPCHGDWSRIATSVTSCDTIAVEQNPTYPPPPPPPPPDDPPVDPDSGPISPIILAVGQSANYQLTSPWGGVWFDLNADGTPDRSAWTRVNDAVGFLALDRNQNGVIDNGEEVFGNFTPLGAKGTGANGFEALTWFDSTEAGGNADGWITPRDSIWPSLRVWVDFNHDGFSQLDELFTLPDLNITAISTAASSEMRRDRFGNTFRLRSQFMIDGHPRVCYDIFLAVATR